MERAHDLTRNKKSTVVNHQSIPNRIFPRQNELFKKDCHSKLDSNNKDKNSLNTDSLDEAMKELLDICQQYNDKLSMKPTANENSQEIKSFKKPGPVLSSTATTAVQTTTTTMTNKCDNRNKQNDLINNYRDNETAKTYPNLKQNQNLLSTSQTGGSIEILQQRQSNLQAQLDEVLQVAKTLASKKKRKLKCILEDDSSSCQKSIQNDTGDLEEEQEEEEEDELIEFQQIENELRISELNRQLDNIQEELRIKLYKRLLSNANNGTKPVQREIAASYTSDLGSSHTFESSPSSSSCCSDEPTTSSNSAAYNVPITITGGTNSRINNNNNRKQHQHVTADTIDGNNIDSKDRQSTWCPEPLLNRSHPSEQGSIKADEEFITNFNSSEKASSSQKVNIALETPTNVQSDLDSAVDNMLEFGALTPTTSKESVNSSRRSPSAESTNIYSNINLNCNNNMTYSHISHYNATSPTCQSTHRNNSANSDLERIEEDEEDCQDYYSDSDKFRTIYEEKLSPIIYEHHQQQQSANNRFFAARSQDVATIHSSELSSSALKRQLPLHGNNCMNSRQIVQLQQAAARTDVGDQRVVGPMNNSNNNDSSWNNSSSSGGASSNKMSATEGTGSRSSRPLTLYLPKPDDEIDLVDHIQAMGHDLSMISDDLKIDSVSAQGYLWKCCSNNSRKWLKRYFYLDRSSQILSYYETEAQLVKKNSSPKNWIHFNEISDVYVDHKLSGIGEKDRSSKRKSYVFVLATTKRKYLLASSRAETMRAWIDTLFTAAKANDYFIDISNMEDHQYV